MLRIPARALLCSLAVLVPMLAAGAADDFKPEPAFTLLLNETNLSGWKTKGGDALEGKAEAFNGRFKVADGVLTIDPKVKGDVIINTNKEWGKDVHIQFDFLPGPGCNNDLFIRGLKFDLKKGDVKNMKEGEWNTFEIIIRGDDAEFKCNGESLKKAKAKPGSSPLGVRAEFGSMQMRRLRAKEGS